MSLYSLIINNNSDSIVFKQSTSTDLFNNVTYIQTYRQSFHVVAAFLKLHSLTRSLNAVEATAVDHIDNPSRFNIIYLTQSITNNTRYLLSTWCSETQPIISLQNLYPAFNWAEREIWDMFGVFFIKHPDLRRILTDYGFVGHPLRKDFPLSGFKEVQYEDLIKAIEYSNTELSQSYRLLSFSNNWKFNE